jgi:hypothetical protein
MEPETTVDADSPEENRQPRTPRKIATHALTGTIIGLLFALIPLSWGSDSFQAIHIILSILILRGYANGFVAFCGILSAISGEKYIDKLIDLSNFIPPV